MKKFIILIALFMSLATIENKIYAQYVTVNININSQPAWGPVGYDYVRYYYIPEINSYYDVNLSLFHFLHRGAWVSARYLPYEYRNYDLYRVYKVVVNDYRPWRYHDRYYQRYARYRGYNHRQPVIYASRDTRYKRSRGNRVEWVNPRGRSNENYADRGRDQKQYRSEPNRDRNNYNSNRSSNSRLNQNNRDYNRERNNNIAPRDRYSKQSENNSRINKGNTQNNSRLNRNNDNFKKVNNTSVDRTGNGRSSGKIKSSDSRFFANSNNSRR